MEIFAGTLLGDRVRCPFHGACFNVKTGDIEEYPGLDSLPSYKVHCSGYHQCTTMNSIELYSYMCELKGNEEMND